MKRFILWFFLPSFVLALTYQSGFRNGKEEALKMQESQSTASVQATSRPEPEYTREIVDTPNGKAVLRRPKRQSPTPIKTESPGFARSARIAKPETSPKDCGCNK